MLQIRMPNSYVVKSTAKSALKGRFITAGVAGILPYFIYLVILALSGVFAMILPHRLFVVLALFVLLSVFLFAPAMLGSVRWFWRMADGCEDSPTEIFYYFSSFNNYKRAIKSILFLLFK